MTMTPEPAIEELWEALRELVKLQAHYAELLNMHDGGCRHSFTSAEEYLDRLRVLRRNDA